MEDRRKTVGQHIKRERQRAGYTSQRAFAKAIGVDPTSVAYAETGDDRIALRGKVFRQIEDRLGMPDDAISLYIETGDSRLLRSSKGAASVQAPASADVTADVPLDWTTVTDQELVDARDTVASRDGEDAADRWLVRAVRLRNEARRHVERGSKDIGSDVGRSA